jgi:hypothetical protein
LPKPLRQPLADDARHDVARSAGRIADDPPHRPRRIIKRRRARDADEQQAGEAEREVAGDFHAA